MRQSVFSDKEKDELLKTTVETIHHFCYGNESRKRYTFKIKDLQRMNDTLDELSDALIRNFLVYLRDRKIVIPIKGSNPQITRRYQIGFAKDELDDVINVVAG